MKENKRYLNCKYLDAGMDGMLCSKTLCTTCKEFNGEKCSDYTSKTKPKNEKQKQKITFGIQECFKCQYKLRCEECVYNKKDISELIKFEKQQASKEMAEKIFGELIKRAENISFFDCRMGLDLDNLAKQLGVEIKE